MIDKKQRLRQDSSSALAPDKAFDVLDDLLSRARKAGADAADAVFVDRRAVSSAYRLGRLESLERSESRILGLRVLIGRRQAIVSSSDLAPRMLAELVERGVAMARVVPEDPFCGLADPSEIGAAIACIDAFDSGGFDADVVAQRARAAEESAMAVPGVTNSEGAEADAGTDFYVIAGTNGLRQKHARSWHSVSVSVLAGQGTGMERDYEYATAVYGSDLEDPAALGRRCSERAVRRLNPRKVASAQVPVVYEARVARSLLGHFSAAINGSAVTRGTTFLLNKRGTRIFSPEVQVVDDPLRPRGLRSRLFDAEGIASRRTVVVDSGVLQAWLLDLGSARQLGMATTGHASRGASSPPSPAATNLYLAAGQVPVEELIGGIDSGLFVTDLMGFGVNGVTGDYSRGAGGFWIENGKLSFPVSEITVSGNLLDMFGSLTPAADLAFRYGVDAPSVRIDSMTVAGR
jgi:PmbA protein